MVYLIIGVIEPGPGHQDYPQRLFKKPKSVSGYTCGVGQWPQTSAGLRPLGGKLYLAIVRTLFWAKAETMDFSLTTSLGKGSETLVLPLVIPDCPECYLG